MVMGIEGGSVFKDTKNQVGQQAHGRADNDHFGFAFLGESDGQGLDPRIGAQGGDGGKVKGLAQAAMTLLAHAGAAGHGAGLVLAGSNASEGGQLPGAVQLIDLRHGGQGSHGRDGANAGNAGQQLNGLVQGGVGLHRCLNLSGQQHELAGQQFDLSTKVFGGGRRGAFQVLLNQNPCLQHLFTDAHQFLELLFGGCRRLPGAGLVLLAVKSDQNGIMSVGFVTAHAGARKEVDGHGIDEADGQAATVQEPGDWEAVAAGGFEADPGCGRSKFLASQRARASKPLGLLRKVAVWVTVVGRSRATSSLSLETSMPS